MRAAVVTHGRDPIRVRVAQALLGPRPLLQALALVGRGDSVRGHRGPARPRRTAPTDNGHHRSPAPSISSRTTSAAGSIDRMAPTPSTAYMGIASTSPDALAV